MKSTISDINKQDELGRTELMHAVLAQDHKKIDSLLSTEGIDPNVFEQDGYTAISIMFEYLNSKTKKSFTLSEIISTIKKLAPISELNNTKFNSTILAKAIKYNFKIAKYLVSKGACLNNAVSVFAQIEGQIAEDQKLRFQNGIKFLESENIYEKILFTYDKSNLIALDFDVKLHILEFLCPIAAAIISEGADQNKPDQCCEQKACSPSQ